MANLSDDDKQKVEHLQLLEQNLNALIAQKQQFQSKMLETESALNEIEKTDKAYKIIGNIMVETAREELKADLTSKKEVIELRIKAIEKQEQSVKGKASVLQKEVLKNMKDD
jgi:prefoldin beta subunit